MCYAIPALVSKIDGNYITLDYFGEKRRARNEFYELQLGDYVLAQGGFIVNKLDPFAAQATLDEWRELFLKLKKVDLNLSQSGNTLYQSANRIRHKHLGNACCVHGIIEFSNYCKNNCLYCGIRSDNKKLKRYRMSIDEILENADYAVNKLGFHALVLQSGEDLFYDENNLAELIGKIRRRCASLIIMSIGERDFSIYKKLYEAGARGVLIRFETSNAFLYEKIKPGQKLEDRIALIKKLYNLGYLIMTGSLIGLPDQTDQDILEDLQLTKNLHADMYSFGPLLPHPDTPFANAEKPSSEKVLEAIARARHLDPCAKILVTTALQTLDKGNGTENALMSGANSLMINLTPQHYKNLYSIYPDRFNLQIAETIEILNSLGRAPADIGL